MSLVCVCGGGGGGGRGGGREREKRGRYSNNLSTRNLLSLDGDIHLVELPPGFSQKIDKNRQTVMQYPLVPKQTKSHNF